MFDWITYFTVFGAGFIGSVHCAGMCGGLACAVCASHGRSVWRRQLLYNLGRITTYVFLGALAGTAGMLLTHEASSWAASAQRLLAILSGALLIVIAMQFFGYSLGARIGKAAVLTDFLAAGLRTVARSPRPSAALALGVWNGFLPCPLVYAFAAQAAASGAALSGMTVMAAFGLGTLPAMLAMGLGGAVFGSRLRRAQVAGTLLLVIGLITLARALLPFSMHGAHT
jgi:hypothetical protein